MDRLTIDVGIDLGTTNSVIAFLSKGKPEILRNIDNSDITPSVIGCIKNRLFVGARAKQLLETSPESVQYEFKRYMGSDYQYVFKECQKAMTPEEMSAEVLKVLSTAYRNRCGESLKAAAITVPAAFEIPQCEATKRAGRLAGFEQVVLLQEPIAAAIAYGFNHTENNVYWLIYDLGGGTFDAALINPREGLFCVVNHRGENHLGGKDIDHELLRQIVIPHIQKETGLDDFTLGNEKWRIPLVKLKNEIENAKIQLSRVNNTPIFVPELFKGVHSIDYDFECELDQDIVARVSQPLIQKTVRLCRELIEESNLTPENIEKLVLVGGPTLAPYVREMLQDPHEGLNIPLEYSIDPMTVVAQGAAIFAGNHKLELKELVEENDHIFRLELTQYERIGAEADPFVGGKIVTSQDIELSDLRLEFRNQRWTSGMINIANNGFFSTHLWGEPEIENLYEVCLYDAKGSPLSIMPNQISYIIGSALTKPILINSIGVALSNNEPVFVLKKGEPLPARSKKNTLYTSKYVKKDTSSVIRIPIIEGENQIADLNTDIGYLDISSSEITRDIPAGSEVEVTIEIDQYLNIRATAYMPILNMDFETEFELKIKPRDMENLLKKVTEGEENIRKIKEYIDENDLSLLNQVWQLEKQINISQIEQQLKSPAIDLDTKLKTEHDVSELMASIDKLKTSFLKDRANAALEEMDYYLNRISNPT